jgi:hypothetical protein
MGKGWSQLPDLGCFTGLAFHSVTAPNEEVATQNRTAFTKETVPCSSTEYRRIMPVFFAIRYNAFGVQNGVHFGVQPYCTRVQDSVH